MSQPPETPTITAPATTVERTILRDLAVQVAEIAALPRQDATRARWRRLNGLRPERPLVMIDQVCWHELEAADPESLVLRCATPWCRWHERRLRRILHQWRHFPVDMVVEPWVEAPLAITNTGFGLAADEEVAVTDPANDVVGHHYRNQLARDEDLGKVRLPVIGHDRAESARRLEAASDVFAGTIAVRPAGCTPYLSLWDPIAMWMGAEDALLALAERRAFMHALLERMTVGYLGMLDQLEEQGLLGGPQSLIHCTGAWSDELPAAGRAAGGWRCGDMWMFGLAQILGSASPRMFRDFEVAYTSRLCARFGLVYYGCCDPLDGKMAEVRRLPRVRKVSMSPWADQRRGAAAIGRDYVFSRKPNPAFLAMTEFDASLVRRDLAETATLCSANGCPLEFILKDLSTVRGQPQRLYDWARIASEVAQAA